MKIDAAKSVVNLEGKPYTVGEGEEKKDLTIGKVVGQALATVKSGDPLRSSVLAQRFYTADEVDATADEVVFITARLKEAEAAGLYFPIILGQAIQALESV